MAVPKPKRRWRVQFSLRTLLLATLLLGSFAALWLHWQPWRLQALIVTSEPPDFAAFSADEKRVVWRWGAVVHVADAKTGEELSTMRAHAAALTYETILNGRPIAITAGYNELHPESSPERDAFSEMYTRQVNCELFENEAEDALQYVVSTLMVKIVIPDDAKARLEITPHVIMTLKHQTPLNALDLIVHGAGLEWTFNNGTLTIVVPDKDRSTGASLAVHVWDLETGDAISTLAGSEQNFRRLFISGNGRYVMAPYPGGIGRVWDASSGKLTANFQMDLVTIDVDRRPSAYISQAAISDDGAHVLAHVDGAEGFEALELTPEQKQMTLADRHPIGAIGWSPNRKYACFQSPNDAIQVWSLTADVAIRDIPANSMPLHYEAQPPLFSSDSDRLLIETVGWSRLLDPETGNEVYRYDRRLNRQFAAKGTLFAFADFGCTEIRATADGALVAELPQSPRTPADAWTEFREIFFRTYKPPLPGTPFNDTPALQFSSDEKRLLAACGSNALGVWAYQRPEHWWGMAWLPEFWSTLLFAGALVWSVVKGRREGSRP